jgi:hypothetical protein
LAGLSQIRNRLGSQTVRKKEAFAVFEAKSKIEPPNGEPNKLSDGHSSILYGPGRSRDEQSIQPC